MQSIRQVARLNETELEKVIPPNASWHTDYRDTAYIYIGGLPFELSEGDILTIFSQYGNPVHVNLVRDKDTGKSRGFCFLKYEDQRSCDLAVDNLSGAGVMGRVVSVDHTRYKLKEGEVEGMGLNGDADGEAGDETDREGQRRSKKRRKSESESEEDRPLIKEEMELQKLLAEHDEDDPMKAYMVEEKRKEVKEALERSVVAKKKDRERKHKHRHRSRRDDEEGRSGHRSGRKGSDGGDDEGRRSGKHHRRERSASPASSEGEREVGKRRQRRDRSASRDAEGKRTKHRSKRNGESDDDRPRRKENRSKEQDELPKRMRKHSLSDRSRSRERRAR